MKLQFNLSSKRVQEAVSEGLLLKGRMLIDVDLEVLSPEDRVVLSRNIDYKSSEDIFVVYLLNGYYSDSRSTSNSVSSEKIEGIIAQMKDLETERAKFLEEEERVKGLQSEVDSILQSINDENFVVERYENAYLYFRKGSFSKQFCPSPSDVRIEKLLDYVKSDQLLLKLVEIKSEYEKIINEAAEKAKREESKKAAIEAGRVELKSWAEVNGSDFLKLKIKHEQNWQSLAIREYAKANSVGFSVFSYEEPEKSWVVKNATHEQLLELEKAQSENHDLSIEIERCKWVDNYGDCIHRTFLRCEVPTPVSCFYLYKEIEDVSVDEEE